MRAGRRGMAPEEGVGDRGQPGEVVDVGVEERHADDGSRGDLFDELGDRGALTRVHLADRAEVLDEVREIRSRIDVRELVDLLPEDRVNAVHDEGVDGETGLLEAPGEPA